MMLALIALLSFFAALFKPEIEGVNLVTLGLCFIAAHLLFGGGWIPWRRSG